MTLTRSRNAPRADTDKADFYHLFWAFLCAAFLGAVVETIFMLLVWGELMNRSSVLYGQFSLVWGAGAVLFTLSLRRLAGCGGGVLFLAGAAVGTAFEYICSWLQEALFGLRFWNYSHLPFNLDGRVCLLFSMFWGAAALLWMRGLWPALRRYLDRPRCPGRRVTGLLTVLMALNIMLTGAALMRMDARLNGETPDNIVEAFLDQKYPDAWLMDYFTHVKRAD